MKKEGTQSILRN